MQNNYSVMIIDRKWSFWDGRYYHIATCARCTWKSDRWAKKADAVAEYDGHKCPGRPYRWHINHESRIK